MLLIDCSHGEDEVSCPLPKRFVNSATLRLGSDLVTDVDGDLSEDEHDDIDGVDDYEEIDETEADGDDLADNDDEEEEDDEEAEEKDNEEEEKGCNGSKVCPSWSVIFPRI